MSDNFNYAAAQEDLIYARTLGRNPAFFTVPRPTIFQRLATFAVLPTTYVKASDWSLWQAENEIDYQVIENGEYRLVIIKATEGTSGVDPVFHARWPRLLDAGVYVMLYHFFHSHLSGEAQADFFLETTYQMREAFLGRIAAWNDIENRAGLPVVSITDRRVRARDFHRVVSANIRKDGAYSSPSLWQSLMGNDQLSNYGDGWLAHWTSAAAPTLPVGWTEAATRIWQTGVYPTYSWVEAVPGVQGTVDVDRWFGDEQSLRDYLGYVDEPPPPDDHEYLQAQIDALKVSQADLSVKVDSLTAEVATLNNRMTTCETRLTELETNPPVPPSPTTRYIFTVTAAVANARFISGYNNPDPPATPRPIMAIHEPRYQYATGANVEVVSPYVLADGGGHYYKIKDSPVPDNQDLFLREQDGVVTKITV